MPTLTPGVYDLQVSMLDLKSGSKFSRTTQFTLR
jgi:hypothetical protein